MNADNLTLGQIKELMRCFAPNNDNTQNTGTLNTHVGTKVIIRTQSSGVWFGKLIEKSGTEVILEDARRLYYWKAKKSISLSGVAVYGVQDCSKICPAIKKQWLDAIEIISCTDDAINSIESQRDVKAS